MSSEEGHPKLPEIDLARLVESLNEAVFFVDAQGILQYISPVIEAFTGVPAENYIGRRFEEMDLSLMPGDERLAAAARRAILQGISTQYEVRLRTPSGELRYLRFSSRALYEDGRLAGEAGTIQDVTDSYRVPSDLGPTTEILNRVFAGSLDGILLADEQGVCLAWSEALERITGLSRRQALGKTRSEIITLLEIQEWHGPAPLQSPEGPILQELAASAGASTHSLHSLHSLDGQQRVIDLVVFEVPSTRGKLRLSIVRDVTRSVDLYLARQEMLRRRNLLASTANRLATEPLEELPSLIPLLLEQAASELQVERLMLNYITSLNPPGYRWFIWCAPGYDLDLQQTPGLLLEKFAWSTQRILAGETLRVGSPQDLPEQASGEKEFMEQHSIQSMLVVPLNLEGRGIGSLAAMDASRRRVWSEDLVQWMTTLGGMLVAALDRYQGQMEMRQSEQNYLAIASLTSDFAVSLEKDKAGKFKETWHIGSFEELFGEPFDPGRPYLSWFHPDDLGRLDSHRQRLLAGKPDVAEFRILTADGGLRWLRSYGYTRTSVSPGENSRVFVAMQDITLEKQAEGELQRLSTDLERANINLKRALLSRDSFLATVSGELRAPLFAIQSNCDLMEEGLFGELTLRQVRSLRSIRDNSKHLMALVNDILDITLLDAGELRLDLKSVDVKEVVLSGLRLVRGQASQKRQLMTFHVDERLTRIEADEARLKQIIANLMTNAVRFTPEDGLINIEALLDEELDQVILSVSDTGVGIELERLHTLFHPFNRAYGSEKRTSGPGLGLVLVRKLAELHGGGVQVQSLEGQGSTFTVTLPYRKPEPRKPQWQVVETPEKFHETRNGSLEPDRIAGSFWAAPAAPGLPGSSARPDRLPSVLLVDDLEESFRPVKDYLEAYGYQVHIARDGGEAVREAQRLRPGVILMDIQLPVMDGVEALRRIRRLPGMENAYVIALSALAMPGDRERFLGAGFNLYLSKPVPLKRVHQAVLGMPQPADAF